MKIVYVSGVKFGYSLLKEILEHNFEISAVISYSDSKKSVYSDFASFDFICNKFNIQNIKVNNINDAENIELLKLLKPDLILVMGWSQLLKKNIIQTSKFGVIGSHPTELPKYRGRAPIPWTIIKELDQSALTFFYIEEGIDDGDILAQKFFSINSDDDAKSLYEKIILLGKKMIIENLELLQNNKAKRIKQDQSKFIEYWPKRNPNDGLIDWSKSCKEIHTLIRATTYPYPGAFTFFKNQKIIIWKADFCNTEISKPGKILNVTDDSIILGTLNGEIIITIAELLNGNSIFTENIFTKNDIGSHLDNTNI
jgi:methionyl-tRNA formyltransferase|tara:strand:- start:21 stop:953 length:933 start_codon:yes stop_codon:yes gene_type:complete